MKNVLIALAVSALTLTGVAHAEDKGFDIAVTIDDLPAHGSVPPGVSRSDVARDYLAALKAHKVPAVYGFVNAIHLKEDPATVETLKMWRAAGYPLGNHSYSHLNINKGGLEMFEADVTADEPILAELMARENWHYLRFPFLNAGTDPTLHAGIMAWLKAKSYRIADVSMSFNDWAYTDTYARCYAKNDQAAIESLKSRYMKGVNASIERSLRSSILVYGRQIPHVLLMHEGAFSALMMPQVLSAFEAKGARYITLDQAESDPAYSETDDHAGEGLLIERTAKQKGVNLWGTDMPADQPIDGLDKMCL